MSAPSAAFVAFQAPDVTSATLDQSNLTAGGLTSAGRQAGRQGFADLAQPREVLVSHQQAAVPDEIRPLRSRKQTVGEREHVRASRVSR